MEKSFEEIKKEIRQKISEIADIPEEKLIDEARFVEDLQIDSMMALGIVAGVEKLYRVKIPEEELSNIRKVGDVYNIVKKVMGI